MDAEISQVSLLPFEEKFLINTRADRVYLYREDEFVSSLSFSRRGSLVRFLSAAIFHEQMSRSLSSAFY